MKTTNNLRSLLRMLFMSAAVVTLSSQVILAQSFDGHNCDGNGSQQWKAGGIPDNITDPGSVNSGVDIDTVWTQSGNNTIDVAIKRDNGGNAGIKMFFDIDGSSSGDATENDADYAFFFSIDQKNNTAKDSAVYMWNTVNSTWDLTSETFSIKMGGSECSETSPSDDQFFEVRISLDAFAYNWCTATTSIEFTHIKTNAGASFTSSDKDEMDVDVVTHTSIDPDPVANITGDNSFCLPNDLSLSGLTSTGSTDGGTTNSNALVGSYEWDLSYDNVTFNTEHTGSTYDSTISVNADASGTVALRITDVYGCESDIETFSWNAYQSPVITGSGQEATNRHLVDRCEEYEFGLYANIDGTQDGALPYSYSFYVPTQTLGVYDSVQGTHNSGLTVSDDYLYGYCLWTGPTVDGTVTITDANGCVAQGQVSPVPVDLVYFDGEVSNGEAILKWQTASEINSERFVVEKSYDGNLYAEVGQVEGAGNSVEIMNYSMIDLNMGEGDVYYRLSQFDFDGSMEVFEPIVLNANMDRGRIIVSPNPSEGQVGIELPATTETSELLILDMTGKEMLRMEVQAELNGTQQNVDLTQLPKGLYYIKYGNARDGFSSQMIQHL